jgi:hypothetical protein
VFRVTLRCACTGVIVIRILQLNLVGETVQVDYRIEELAAAITQRFTQISDFRPCRQQTAVGNPAVDIRIGDALKLLVREHRVGRIRQNPVRIRWCSLTTRNVLIRFHGKQDVANITKSQAPVVGAKKECGRVVRGITNACTTAKISFCPTTLLPKRDMLADADEPGA